MDNGQKQVTDLKIEFKNRGAKATGTKEKLIERFMAISQFLRRNLVSISFPVLTATFIFLDWNHTRKWKLLQQKN